MTAGGREGRRVRWGRREGGGGRAAVVRADHRPPLVGWWGRVGGDRRAYAGGGSPRGGVPRGTVDGCGRCRRPDAAGGVGNGRGLSRKRALSTRPPRAPAIPPPQSPSPRLAPERGKQPASGGGRGPSDTHMPPAGCRPLPLRHRGCPAYGELARVGRPARRDATAAPPRACPPGRFRRLSLFGVPRQLFSLAVVQRLCASGKMGVTAADPACRRDPVRPPRSAPSFTLLFIFAKRARDGRGRRVARSHNSKIGTSRLIQHYTLGSKRVPRLIRHPRASRSVSTGNKNTSSLPFKSTRAKPR